jgi:predicted O-linked N-acetylglucosamine transferase (SPINDLY family)
VFSYGRNDESDYRKSLEHLAHKFVDIAALSYAVAADAIRAEKIDILLDMQIHTLGSRLEITASGVAPLVLNYLVYPGTSGAAFYDYIVADSSVLPAEHAAFYSEAVLLLPATYQISTYEHYNLPDHDIASLISMSIPADSAPQDPSAARSFAKITRAFSPFDAKRMETRR